MNKVFKVILKKDIVCFIINTEGETDFWYWEISRGTWDRFWENKPNRLTNNITKRAEEFVNSDECSTCGCSCGNFISVEEAVNEYNKK